MKILYTLMDKLLKLCNSSLKISFRTLGIDFSKITLVFQLKVKGRFLLKIYKKEKEKGVQIFILVRKGDEDGKKISNEL